jgi:hypothetical protein
MAGFAFGQRQPYFSGQPTEQEHTGTSKVFGAAALFAGSAAVFSAGFIPFRDGNLFDVAYKAGKVAGVASPFGIVSSLRIPEIISPFLSNNFQSSGKGHVDFGEDYLSNSDTRRFLAAKMGVTEHHLSNLGVGSGSTMRFKRATGFAGMFGRGSMSVIGQNGTETTVSDQVMLTSLLKRLLHQQIIDSILSQYWLDLMVRTNTFLQNLYMVHLEVLVTCGIELLMLVHMQHLRLSVSPTL